MIEKMKDQRIVATSVLNTSGKSRIERRNHFSKENIIIDILSRAHSLKVEKR